MVFSSTFPVQTWSAPNTQNANFSASKRDLAVLKHISCKSVHMLYREQPPRQI